MAEAGPSIIRVMLMHKKNVATHVGWMDEKYVRSSAVTAQSFKSVKLESFVVLRKRQCLTGEVFKELLIQ